MNNKFIYIGDNKIAGVLKMEKPQDSAEYYSALSFEQEQRADESLSQWYNHIKSLPKIEVSGAHNWQDGQILVENLDFVITETWFKGQKTVEAFSTSKEDQKKHLIDIMQADQKDGLYEPNLVKEGERLFTKEEMIGFAEWIKENYKYEKGRYRHLGDFYKNDKKLKTTEELFNLYLSSPEFKNNNK